jgi:hypothetical protein
VKISPSVAGLAPVPRTMDSIEPRFKMVGEEYSALLMSSKLTIDFSISLLANNYARKTKKNQHKKRAEQKDSALRVQLLAKK